MKLQIKERIFTAEEIIPLLNTYQMLPQFLSEVITDRAINYIDFNDREKTAIYQQFYEQNRITSSELKNWLAKHGLTKQQLESLIIRKLKIEKFKKITWGHQLESYFLEHKWNYDRVIYSLIQVDNLGVARELYHRLLEKEESFAELAKKYSLGSEAILGGAIGPVKLSKIEPNLARMLHSSQPNRILPPIFFKERYLIVRLEKLIPTQLDEAMRQQLLDELFDRWLQEQLIQLEKNGAISVN